MPLGGLVARRADAYRGRSAYVHTSVMDVMAEFGYSQKHDEMEMEKMERNRARGKTHSRSKKDFPMALLDSLF